jgi:hypothetical protein
MHTFNLILILSWTKQPIDLMFGNKPVSPSSHPCCMPGEGPSSSLSGRHDLNMTSKWPPHDLHMTSTWLTTFCLLKTQPLIIRIWNLKHARISGPNPLGVVRRAGGLRRALRGGLGSVGYLYKTLPWSFQGRLSALLPSSTQASRPAVSLGDGLTRRGREGAGGRGEEKGSGAGPD